MNKKICLLALGIMMIFPYSVEAQTGSISGVITDNLQNPVPLARVSVNGAIEAAITDINGSYLIENLSPGFYDISVNRSDYHRAIISGVEVIEDSTTLIDFDLERPQVASIPHAYIFFDEIWVPVDINNNLGVGGFDFLIKWLPDYFNLESVYASSRIDYGNLNYIIGDAGPGTVRIHWDAGTSNPMPTGEGSVIFLHFLADSSLGDCDNIPVYFTGSQVDNAVYDSGGEPLLMDNFFSGSILSINPQGNGCYDTNWNGWPVDMGDMIIIHDRLIYGYGVWRINPVLQELMADFNNNGFVDIADVLTIKNMIHGNPITGNYPLLRFPTYIDPNIRDALIIGNLDGSPVTGHPGETVDIPIYFRTDEEVEGFALRLSADTSRISERLGAELTPVLEDWIIDPGPEIDFQPDYRGHTALISVGSGNPLNTNGQWSDATAHFTVRLADYGFSGGESILLKARASVMDSNYVVYQPLVIEGSILVEIADCSYTAGDANGDGLFNGLDVIFSVGYFKGQWSSVPTDCYCGSHGFYGANADSNGDCLFNGLDIVFSVAALKETGPLPRACPECPPE